MKGKYLTAANGVTIFRLVLFLLFLIYLYLQQPIVAGALLLAAWGLDAIDGFVARIFHQQSDIGSWLDKTIDRAVIGLGVLALIAGGYIPPKALLLLTKDIGLFPLFTIQPPGAWWVQGLGWTGKGMTFLQGIGILWLLLDLRYANYLLGIVAVAGGAVAVWHLNCVVRKYEQRN
ncbi:MAG: CDP-alcohol phosphatidyltransferase family protein [Candidatus Andersenbacteria bacterium]